MSLTSQKLFPLPSADQLKATFIGQSLYDVPAPSAILDISKVKHNCKLMLDAVKELQVNFRAHIKTHKTAELTRLQVGEDCKDVRLIVSTVMEAEHIVPVLQAYQTQGAKINVLYGVPLAPSAVSRLAKVAQTLGHGSLSLMIDNPTQLSEAQKISSLIGSPVSIFIKTDSGYHRAGLGPLSERMIELVKAVSDLESQNHLSLLGFYSHNSLSYNGTSPDAAMDMLKVEIDVCKQASTHLSSTRDTPIVISVGASPTALSIQNIQPSHPPTTESTSATRLRDTLDLTSSSFDLEIHAGVYPVFDMQQVSAASRHPRLFPDSDPHSSIALTILAETVSIYPDRTAQPEALITTGSLALGREPCHSYPGWAVVSSWNMSGEYDATNADKRIIVSRISQEHGILGWQNQSIKDVLPLEYGQKVRLWPNHACITGAGYGWYLIVDGSEGKGETVVDVWVRWRGW